MNVGTEALTSEERGMLGVSCVYHILSQRVALEEVLKQ